MLQFIKIVNRNCDFENVYNNYDVVIVQFIVQIAELEKYAVVFNLCISKSLEKVILERSFKL